MGGSRTSHQYLRFLIVLVVVILLLGLLGISACSGGYQGKTVTFKHPASEIRKAFQETIEEIGGHVESRNNSSDIIRGKIGEYSFSLKIKQLKSSATQIRFRVVGNSGGESRTLESLVTRILGNKLARSHVLKQKLVSSPPSIAKYESTTVCLYGSTHVETFQSSGVAISSDGLVLTTAHEISNAQSLFVKWPDKSVAKGKIVFMSKLYDLALVKTGAEGIPFISLSSSKSIDVPVGEIIYTFGCPYGLIGTLARGRIAAAPRIVGNILLYQCDLPVYPGNSGGPVFDDNGELVGLVKGRLKDTDDISFIIPAFYLSVFLEENAGRIVPSKQTGSTDQSKDWAYWFGLGLAGESFSSKESAFKQVLKLRPNFTPALYHLGLVINRMGKIGEELKVWKRLVRLRPRWSEAWYRLGNALFKSGDLEGASRAYRRAISLSPEDPRYYNNLGEICRREKKYKKAEVYFKKAISLYPGYALAHYNLGILFDQALDKPELAVYHYREYLKLSPNAPDRIKVEKWIREAEKRF